jgi:hypothetical protein
VAQLQNPDGTPLSWPEALERNRRYWETHERDGEVKVDPPAPTSRACAARRHSKCSGFNGHHRNENRVMCGCGCHS